MKHKLNNENIIRDLEIISLMQNKNLLKENPFDESSIYIKNSDLKQSELIRNVNIHILPNEIKNIHLNKNLSNSYNSKTIRNEDDDDIGISSLMDSLFINEDYDFNDINTKQIKNNFYKINKGNIKITKKPSKPIFENIYKN